MQHVLELDNIQFKQPDGHLVFNNFTLKIEHGERVGIIGPNGTGKTTMFLLTAGVYRPTAGMVRLFEQKVIPGKFNPNIGMIFQNQDDQLFSPSVWEDIAFGLQNIGIDKKQIEEQVNHVLAELQITHLKDKPPHHLSGGEKRLVAIAGVMVMEPKLMIWDEPTSNLDMRYRRRLIDVIHRAPQDAMMIASHDLEFILEICNRTILIDTGEIIADGIPSELLGDERLLQSHGLEMPYSLK
ncbi:energy-coupling factor ABC transporter ATP-binding protein [Calidifontibacillus oryziterrae]|uniref:energy-coupling factor ABC transporter ATP-binding protein n=1 Tax=Calidifontibacillus oryziterrae TaxID=1191699 RepID=UPI0002ED176C|nr:energy-coupling factor ABC transporter ATP-binding protein [Calidifontibacillus oryziterrae]